MDPFYMYKMDELAGARSSSGYRAYSCFFKDGYFWSVAYECAFGKFMSQRLGEMSAGNGQLAARIGTFHIFKIWLHCLHYSELEDCSKKVLTTNCDCFLPEYEIDLSDPLHS